MENTINVNTYFDKIFYMNLARDVDRNKSILEQFKKFNITNFERIEGKIFTEIPHISLWRNLNQTDDKYILGNLGHQHSTIEIIKLSKERKYERILILEDDIEILDDPSYLLTINKNILYDWDILYFGGIIEPFFRNQIVCIHAYALTNVLFDDIINMLPVSGMETDNFYAKIIQHMFYKKNKNYKYNTRMIEPFDRIVQNRNTHPSNINENR
jgi:hypothetical protein